MKSDGLNDAVCGYASKLGKGSGGSIPIPDPNGMFRLVVPALGTGIGEVSPDDPELNGDLTALASCMFQLGRNALSPGPASGDDEAYWS